MNRTNNLITIIFSISLVANATGGPLQKSEIKLIQSESKNYELSMTEGEITNIGKVYEDLNGDGYQADATARHIVIKGEMSKDRYIPGSTTITLSGEQKAIKDESIVKKGIEIDELKGISKQGTPKNVNKAVIRFETSDINWEPITISTEDGTNISLDSAGKQKEENIKNVESGLAGENLKITRNVYRQKNKDTYLQEIIVENLGVYEEGIPGVRLITVDGIVVETDIYGRYHIPDEWILKKEGKKILLKVDEQSLPDSMSVVSENPRVKNVTSENLSKINFSIQENQQEERGDENE